MQAPLDESIYPKFNVWSVWHLAGLGLCGLVVVLAIAVFYLIKKSRKNNNLKIIGGTLRTKSGKTLRVDSHYCIESAKEITPTVWIQEKHKDNTFTYTTEVEGLVIGIQNPVYSSFVITCETDNNKAVHAHFTDKLKLVDKKMMIHSEGRWFSDSEKDDDLVFFEPI